MNPIRAETQKQTKLQIRIHNKEIIIEMRKGGSI